MTKIAKKLLLIVCTFLFVSCFGIVGMLGLNTDKKLNAKAATAVSFDSVAGCSMTGTVWEAHSLLSLKFSGALDPDATTTSGSPANDSGDLMSKTTIGGEAASGKINFYVNTFYKDEGTASPILEVLFLSANASTYAVGTQFHIEEGAAFAGVVLPEVTLYYTGSTWAEPVTFTGVNESQNNDVWEENDGFTATFLEFEGATFATVNGTSATAGATGIYWTASGSETPNYFEHYWVTVSTNTIKLLNASTVVIPNGATLHVVEGTVFQGVVLPEVTLYMVNGNWQAPVTFMNVNEAQNNDVWESGAGFMATYLVFDKDFVTADTNFVNKGAGNDALSAGIYYVDENGAEQKFDFIWVNSATNTQKTFSTIMLLESGTTAIADGSVLHIKAGTILGNQVMPELTLYMVNGNWQTEKPAPAAKYLGIADGWNMGTPSNATRRILGLQFDQALSVTQQNSNLFSGNTLNITLDGVAVNAENLSPRCYYNIADYTILELLFKNYTTVGTAADTYATGVTLQFGTKLEIKDSTVNGYKLDDVTLYFNGETWQENEPPKDVSYSGITWNGSGYNEYEGKTVVLLKYGNDGEKLITDEATDLTATLGDIITVGGVKVSEMTGGLIMSHPNYGASFLLIQYDATYATHRATLEIPANTIAGNAILPELTLYFNVETGVWQAAQPALINLTFSSIEWNVSGHNEYAGKSVVLLKYTGNQYAISKAALDLTAELGDSITVKDTKISEMTDGLIMSHPNYGACFLLIQYDATYATHGAALVVPVTEANNAANIPALTLYMNAETGKWQTAEPDPLEAPKANYVGISGNDMSGTVWNAHSLLQIKFDQALAPNTTDIQGSEKNANNSGNLSTQLTLGGEHVTMGAQVNFYVNAFAYATTEGGNVNSEVLEILFISKKAADFAHATKLHIPDGTLFGEVQLAEVTLYFNAETEKWQEEKPAPLVGGFSAEVGGSIRVSQDENNGLRFETHIEKTTYDSLVETYGKENLKIGTYILPAAWLTLSGKTLESYVTTYTAEGGYYLDISTWNETKGDFGFANSNAAGEITDGATYYKYYGTIANIKFANYAEDFIGVGYLWITDQNGDKWLYLAHDGDWSRNVYEIAKKAYENTATVSDDLLSGVTPYFDRVIEISTDGSEENGLVYDIESVLEARPSYGYTKPTDYEVTVENGVITIASTSNAVYSVLINGEKAGVMAAEATAYADYYALNAELFDKAEDAGAINYGIGEPTQELWGTQTVEDFKKTFTAEMNTNSTASNIAKVNASFDGNTARIWFQMADVCWPDSLTEFKFQDGAINAIQSVIDDFVAEGVTNISLMSGVANYRSTKNYYNVDNNTWYTFWDALGGQTATPYPGLIVLPNEGDYEEFLTLQGEYFKQLALNLRGVTVIEVLNELEMADTKFRSSIETGGMPDIGLIAQAAMDICKAATDGVKAAGKNIKITMPALACVTEVKDGENVTRHATTDLLTAMYDYIDSVSGNPDDYFQIINIHPYVFLSSSTSNTNYLYSEKDGTCTKQDAMVIKNRWMEYVEGLRTIAVDNGDAEKPFWITEFGIADYELCDGKSNINADKWSDYRNNTLARQTEVFQTIWSAIQEMPYIDTVIFFRLGDYEHTTSHSFANCGEASYGMYDKDGNLKEIGKNLYNIVTGKTDYEKLVQTIA